MNTLETRSTPNKPSFQLAAGFFSTLTAAALLTSCNRSYDDPINRAEITALQLRAKEQGLPPDCSYLYRHVGNNNYVLREDQLESKGLSEAAQELTAQNNSLVVPDSLTGGKPTGLSELQKKVITISSHEIARTMLSPTSMPDHRIIALCPSKKVLIEQPAHVVVVSQEFPPAARS